MKIDCMLPKHSQYAVLDHFITKLYEAFQRAGHSCRLLSEENRFIIPQKSPPDFTIAFNGVPINDRGEFLCDLIKKPHISLLVDPPYRYLMITQSPHIMIGCDDEYGCELLQSWGFERTFFLPHAVERELQPDSTKERVFDVSMLATYIDEKKCKQDWERQFPKEICKMMEEAAEMALYTPTSFIKAYYDLYEKLAEKYPKGKFNQLQHSKALQKLELYLKGLDRIRLAESITDSELHLFGSPLDMLSWKTHFGKRKSNIHVHGGINFESAIKVMQQSKIVLNPSIKNKQGAHERLFSGLACGALVATNESEYLQKFFHHQQDLLYYNHLRLKDLNFAISDLLSNEDERLKIVNQGREKVMSAHTWDHRAQEILKYCSRFL